VADLPTGTVTFLFTDLEGSTRLLEAHPTAYRDAVRRHHALLLSAVEGHGGVVFETVGDAVYAAFARPSDAVAAALAGQRALLAADWGDLGAGALKARMGLHTGEVEAEGAHYFGAPLYRCARLTATAHGGQVVLSGATAELVRDELPDGRLRDLGAHRLKDLARPERLFQLLHPELPNEFPPLRALDALPHNLPVQLTSFVGRERELAAVREALSACRLVTLTGPGGVGKTRLALQAAADLLEVYPDGVWLVDLAPLADAALVPQAVAAAVGVREIPGRPLLATLTDTLSPKRLLLVLDNCEHLADACAALADAVLRACPNVRILATSRTALGITGEALWRVPSLSLPDDLHAPAAPAAGPAAPEGRADAAGAVVRCDAVRLLADRARTVQPAFAVTEQNAATVARLCRRLDGIPLALELAAARLRVLTVDELLRRLDDRFRLLTGGGRTAPPRHQTLRALVEWSHGLLAAPDRRLFDRLGVFAGSFTLEAAERVCAGEGLAAGDVLDGLTRLVDQSLVQPEPGPDGVGRYRLLETLRHYARERLTAAGAAEEVARRHAHHFVALAEAAEPALLGPDQVAWLDRLEADLDDVRAALRWGVDRGEAELGLRLAGALWKFWHVRWYRGEGRHWLETLLALPEPAPPVAGPVAPGARHAARAKALFGAALLAWMQSDLAAARALHTKSAALYEALEDATGIARARGGLGMVALRGGDLAAARPLLLEALARYREAGDEHGVALGLEHLGMLEVAAGDGGAARAALEESVAVQRRVGDGAVLQTALGLLGEAARMAGDRDAARQHWQEALGVARALGYRGTLVGSLLNLGALAQADGDVAGARARYGEALEAAWGSAWELVPWVLDQLASLALLQARPAPALRLFGAAAALRRAARWTVEPRWGRAAWRARRDDHIAAARAALPKAQARSAWAEGQGATLDQVFTLARTEATADAGAAVPTGGRERTGLEGRATGRPLVGARRRGHPGT
jgi:predicted ATPase/class 3 adenylate cyclase